MGEAPGCHGNHGLALTAMTLGFVSFGKTASPRVVHLDPSANTNA
jgi:hypothetical protein